MKALILAGGYGTRLGDLTKEIPKPMIDINGKPVLKHIIDNLNNHGIKEIIVNVHYLPDKVLQLDSNVLYFYTQKLLGHDGTMRALQGWLNDDFLVINGDTISNLNYTEMIKFHKEETITVAMDEWRCAGSWIYCSKYFENPDLFVHPYRQTNLVWHDVGTPDRLEKAREFFK